jgi:low temperature requirement protein LtrA
MTSPEQSRAHRLRLMSGRDPNEQHRAATPLELLYDLTFVVAFGVAAEQLAHLLAEGHFAAGFVGFMIAIFAVCWCWINYSWFASAYDRRRAAAGRERVIAVPRPVSLSRLVWLLQVLINVCGGDRAFADS